MGLIGFVLIVLLEFLDLTTLLDDLRFDIWGFSLLCECTVVVWVYTCGFGFGLIVLVLQCCLF